MPLIYTCTELFFCQRILKFKPLQNMTSSKTKTPKTKKEWQEFLQDPMVDGKIKIETMSNYFDDISNDTGFLINEIETFLKQIEWSLDNDENMFKTLIVYQNIIEAQDKERIGIHKLDYRFLDIPPIIKIDPKWNITERDRQWHEMRITKENLLLQYKLLYTNWDNFLEYDRFKRPLEFLKKQLKFYKPDEKTENVQIKWELTASEFCYLFLKLEELNWIKLPKTDTDSITALLRVFLIEGNPKIDKLKSGLERINKTRASFGNLKNEFNMKNNTATDIFKNEFTHMHRIDTILNKKMSK